MAVQAMLFPSVPWSQVLEVIYSRDEHEDRLRPGAYPHHCHRWNRRVHVARESGKRTLSRHLMRALGGRVVYSACLRMSKSSSIVPWLVDRSIMVSGVHMAAFFGDMSLMDGGVCRGGSQGVLVVPCQGLEGDCVFKCRPNIS